MNFKKMTCAAISGVMAAAAIGGFNVLADETLYSARFDFGSFGVAEGYTQITCESKYDAQKGYGFVETVGLSDGGQDIVNDYVTSSGGDFTFDVDVPDGDYEVKITNGGDTDTEINIYINGGERVRVYTVKAEKYGETVQRVVPKNGKISIRFKGNDIKTNTVEITQLENRTEKGEKPTIYIAGDSTAQSYKVAGTYPQTGWGQVISSYFTDNVIIENRSMAGRSSKSYDNDGRLDNILTDIKPGDYLLIQFGHNDGSTKPERYISIEDFKKLIGDKYIGEAVKRGAIPVVLTPTPHFSPDESGKFAPTIIDYAQAAKEVAQETGTAFIDVQAKIAERWNELGVDKVRKFYFINEPGESVAYPEGTDDHTHFKEAGAKEVAQIVAQGLAQAVPELKAYAYTKENPITFSDTIGHWAENIISEAANLHIVSGVSKESFEPERSVTRAEFLTLAMRANDINGKAWRKDDCYSDVTADDWFRFDVQGAMDKGIIPEQMLDGNKFEPNKEITREEMATILVKAYEFAAGDDTALADNKKIGAQAVFSDFDGISDWAAEYVDKAYKYSFMEGSMSGDKVLIKPTDTATRAEAATVVLKCVKG